MAKQLQKLFYTLAVLCIACLAYYRIWFLRMPDRNIPANNHVLVSPANGVVVSITPWSKDNLMVPKEATGVVNVWTKDVDTMGTMVSIQMNVSNVHYQRAPADSRVLSEHYVKGNFNNAIRMNNELGIRFENEHNEILFQTAEGLRYKVIQIAGFLARRIEDYVEPGNEVKQGDVIGLIKLGSQVTIILPQQVTPVCKVGQNTIEGETIIAEIR